MLAYIHSTCVVCGSPLPAGLRFLRRTCDGGRCQVAYRQHLETGRAVCSVCGRPLSGRRASLGGRCDDLACRRVIASQDNAGEGAEPPRCGVCRVFLPPERAGAGLCGCRECGDVDSRRRAAARAEERAKRLAEIRRVAELHRSLLAQDAGIADPASYPVTIVPSFGRELCELPAARQARFAVHLRSVIDDVFAERAEGNVARVQSTDDASAGETPPSQRLLATACAMCRGKCCANGGEHAYVSAETIRRFVQRHPDARPEDVATAYLERVPERTFADSCVYHGERGCVLPTDLRPATCNEFFCDGLHGLGNELAAGAPPRTFFVSAEDLTILAMKFVDVTR